MHAKRAGKGRWPFKVFAPYPEEDVEEDRGVGIGIGVRVGIGRRVAAAEKETQRCETETVGEYVR